MATQQPSNAPDDLPENARDDATAPSVLTDDAATQVPAAGAVAGPDTVDPLGGSGRGSIGSNADVSADPAAATPDNGAHEAALQALESPPGGEAHPSSR